MHSLPALFCLGLLAVPSHGRQAVAVPSSAEPSAASAPKRPCGPACSFQTGHGPEGAPPAAAARFAIRVESEPSRGHLDAERARKRGAHMMLLRRLLLEKYDRNGDDLITDDERLSLLRDARAAKAAALRQLIARFDADGDGKLDAEELGRLQRAVRPAAYMRVAVRTHERGAPPPAFHPVPPPPPDGGPVALLVRQLLMEAYDTDGDGKLSPSERQTIDADSTALFEERKRALLTRFDANGDGRLDAEELKRARRTLDAERELGRELCVPPARPDAIDLYLNTYYDLDVIRSLDAEPER